MNEPNRTKQEDAASQAQTPSSPITNPSPPLTLILIILCTAGGVLTGLCPDLLSASVIAAITAGLYSYTFCRTFAPAAMLIPILAAPAAWLLTTDFFNALQALLFLPLGVSVCLSMLKTRRKTAAVIHGALACGISLLVLFLVAYIMTHGTLSPEALKTSYNETFEKMRVSMTDSMLSAYESMEQAASNMTEGGFSHPVIDGNDPAPNPVDPADAQKQAAATRAYITALVELSVNSVKLAMPALIAVLAQILAYVSLGIYRMMTRLCRTHYMLPRTYRITVSRTSAVIFVISYLINLFPTGSGMTLLSITTANLATMLTPGVFVMGLTNLQRRAKDPMRRRSFFITAAVLTFLVILSPSYAVFFILVDGIGEIFFGGRSLL